ncbi:hypothetical protein V3W47_07355 [Deinococcus sp. YIM 134068]|uniref:hypothetical protein n=1 Tax=Deinococcus lichenicola TaxID=3118910 RepID=UPI002F95E030
MEREGAAVRLQVILEVDSSAQRNAFETWAEQAGVDVEALENEGCGCCVDIYTFCTSPASAAELEVQLNAVGSRLDSLADT